MWTMQFSKYNRLVFSSVLAVVFLACATAQARASSKPIEIEADRMISQEQSNSVVFMGDVDAKQGDLTIRCQEMTVFYTQEKGREKTSQVKKLICKRDVEISKGNWLGTGNRMDYFARDRKVILAGNAKAWKGPNMVSGRTIIYYLDEGRSIVEQDRKSKGRVRATIHPDSKKKK